MDEVQSTQLQSLRAAQQFLDAHGPRLGTINESGARRRLDELVTRAEQCTADQVASEVAARGETQRYQQRRRTLLTHMAAITRIARDELASTPDISALSMPQGKPSAVRLVAAARGLAKVAAPHAAVFTGAGLPADFLADFTAVTDAMQASYDARVRRQGERRSATTSLARHLRDGRQQLPILVAFLKSDPLLDPSLLADWQASTRIPQRSRRMATEAAVAIDVASAVPATATATATLLLEPPPVQVALPAPQPMKLLMSGTPPAMPEEARASSLIAALLRPFRRKAG